MARRGRAGVFGRPVVTGRTRAAPAPLRPASPRTATSREAMPGNIPAQPPALGRPAGHAPLTAPPGLVPASRSHTYGR